MTDPTRPMPGNTTRPMPGNTTRPMPGNTTRPMPGNTTRPTPPSPNGPATLAGWLLTDGPDSGDGPWGHRKLELALESRYRIEAQIGAGGMGRVFRARDLQLERTVALKTIQPHALAEPEWVARFRLEAVLAAGLQHPGIVQVHQIREAEGVPILVMEYVEGPTLDDYLRQRRPSGPELARIMAEVCRAVTFAHRHGIIHRDLKPGNIMIDPAGNPKVMDFGLAKRVLDPQDGSRTQEGTIMGSPAYMSPEQARGEISAIDTRTDVYALGGTLYSALTGRPPFRGDNFVTVVDQVLNREVTPPSHLRPGLDRDLESICLKALEKDPRRRYRDAATMARDLEQYLAGRPISARRYGPLEKVRRAVTARREAFLLSLAALTVMMVGIVATLLMLHGNAREVIFQTLRHKVTGLAATAALLVDPTQVRAVSAGSDDAPARALAALLDAIRQQNPDVRYVQILRPSPQGLPMMEFVVENQSFAPLGELDGNGNGVVDPGERPARPGDPYDASRFPQLLAAFQGPTARENYRITDQWDVALAGYAPIRDASGEAIAILGVDVLRPELNEQLDRLDGALVTVLVLTGTLALILGTLVVVWIVGLWSRSLERADQDLP